MDKKSKITVKLKHGWILSTELTDEFKRYFKFRILNDSFSVMTDEGEYIHIGLILELLDDFNLTLGKVLEMAQMRNKFYIIQIK